MTCTSSCNYNLTTQWGHWDLPWLVTVKFTLIILSESVVSGLCEFGVVLSRRRKTPWSWETASVTLKVMSVWPALMNTSNRGNTLTSCNIKCPTFKIHLRNDRFNNAVMTDSCILTYWWWQRFCRAWWKWCNQEMSLREGRACRVCFTCTHLCLLILH